MFSLPAALSSICRCNVCLWSDGVRLLCVIWNGIMLIRVLCILCQINLRNPSSVSMLRSEEDRRKKLEKVEELLQPVGEVLHLNSSSSEWGVRTWGYSDGVNVVPLLLTVGPGHGGYRLHRHEGGHWPSHWHRLPLSPDLAGWGLLRKQDSVFSWGQSTEQLWPSLCIC